MKTPPRTVVANPVINSAFEEAQRHLHCSEDAMFAAQRGPVTKSRGTAPDWAAYYIFAMILPEETARH